MATPETEARLLAVGRAGTAAHVERIVRGWRVVDRQVENRTEATRHRGRRLQVYTDADGMVVVRGRLTPEAGGGAGAGAGGGAGDAVRAMSDRGG